MTSESVEIKEGDVAPGDETPPGIQCVAGEVSSSEPDVERCCREFAAKLTLLARRSEKSSEAADPEAHIADLKALATSMSQAEMQDQMNRLVSEMEAADRGGSKAVQVAHTVSEPLSMCKPEFW